VRTAEVVCSSRNARIAQTEVKDADTRLQLRARDMKYKSLKALLAHELTEDEDPKAKKLFQLLRSARRKGYLTRKELIAICKWKSPRSAGRCLENSSADVRAATRRSFTSHSERVRFEALCSLHGVGPPVASAILTVVDPKRYGVIDIRVWQLLLALSSVRTRPSGMGFTFANWYQYLMILRHHAKRLQVPVRRVEYSLFCYHRKIQQGTLYQKRAVG